MSAHGKNYEGPVPRHLQERSFAMYPSVAPHMLQLGDGMGLPWPMTDRCMFPRVAIFIFWSKDGCCICFWSLKQLACDPGCMLTWPSKRKSRLDCSNGDCPSTNLFCLTPEWACYCTFMLDSLVCHTAGHPTALDDIGDGFISSTAQKTARWKWLCFGWGCGSQHYCFVALVVFAWFGAWDEFP